MAALKLGYEDRIPGETNPLPGTELCDHRRQVYLQKPQISRLFQKLDGNLHSVAALGPTWTTFLAIAVKDVPKELIPDLKITFRKKLHNGRFWLAIATR